MQDKIEGRVIRVIGTHLKHPKFQHLDLSGEIRSEQSFRNDFAFDELDDVELLMEIEDEFGLEIPDARVPSIATVSDLIRAVAELSPRK